MVEYNTREGICFDLAEIISLWFTNKIKQLKVKSHGFAKNLLEILSDCDA
jgi:hypothetical protein